MHCLVEVTKKKKAYRKPYRILFSLKEYRMFQKGFVSMQLPFVGK